MNELKDYELKLPTVTVIFKGIKTPSVLGLLDIGNTIKGLIVFPDGKYCGQIATRKLEDDILTDLNTELIKLSNDSLIATAVKFKPPTMSCEIIIEKRCLTS